MQMICCCQLSPSVLGLQSMLDICVSFRLRCNVMFNTKESICIAVTRKKLQSKLISRIMMDNHWLGHIVLSI